MEPIKSNHLSAAWGWAIPNDASVQACFEQTNWEAICRSASSANRGQPCKILPAYTAGGNNLARLLEFQDGTRWIARIQLRKSAPETSRKMQTEIDTVALLKVHTRTPLPRIFAANLDDANPAGAAFMLLEFLPGNTAMGEARSSGGLIPLQYRQKFNREVAAAHAQIASARLLKIGTVVRNADGSFTAGPIPGIGGPFDTASSFIQAWASHVKYPHNKEYLRQYVPPLLLDEILEGTTTFPQRVANLAVRKKCFTLDGPFPVRHADFFHSNIIVTKSFDVLGVIDWDGACTVPWELVDVPCFMSTVPRLLNPPEQYDEFGQPRDKNESKRWEEKRIYTKMVQEAEQTAGVDHRLSMMLTDTDAQDLAGTIHLYMQGKIGLYGRTLDYFEAKQTDCYANFPGSTSSS